MSFAALQAIVASVEASTASCIVIPAPSAEPDVSPEPLLIVIFLSSTSKVAVLRVVVVPFTVRLPPIVALPVVVTEAKVTSSFVPTDCPIATVGVALSPELLLRVTPVPATKLST